ncbi:hypothetical protein QQ045_001303 [Rhodiola kirilowii]
MEFRPWWIGISGVTKTVVAPLESVKILLQESRVSKHKAFLVPSRRSILPAATQFVALPMSTNTRVSVKEIVKMQKAPAALGPSS